MFQPKIVVVGSCMIDLVSYTSRLPKPGETLQGIKFSKGFGGKGANQCIAAARLGGSVTMVAKVGQDSFGDDYLRNFKTNGITTDHVYTTDDAATGVAAIAVDNSGQNSIIIVSGANLLLNKEDVAKAAHLINNATVVVGGFEANIDATLEALTLAHNQKVTTILNAAPAISKINRQFFAATDIFCVNETEAEIIIEKPVKTIEDAKIAVDEIIKLGCRTVIITLGENGAVFRTRESSHHEHTVAKKVTPVDTTGAGDAFVGALAFFIAHHPHLSLKEQVQRSCDIASISVQREGTQASYVWENIPNNFTP